MALCSRIWSGDSRRAFPDNPPYGGAFDDVVPHLTVGERRCSSASALETAQTSVSQQLPIRARIDRAVLIAGTAEPDSWHSVHEFDLPTLAGCDS